jgi:hypothetical protein
MLDRSKLEEIAQQVVEKRKGNLLHSAHDHKKKIKNLKLKSNVKP